MLKKYLLYSFILTVTAVLFSGCEKEEALYPKPNVPAGLQTKSFAMGEFYKNQLWFDFESQKEYTNAFGQWDLGFSCNGEPKIILCAGKHSNYSVAKVLNVPFNDIHVLDLKKLNWEFDSPCGDADSLAFKNCFVKQPQGYSGLSNETYIIDLGTDTSYTKRYIKMKIHTVRGGVYEIQWGFVFEPGEFYLTKIYTNTSYNYAYFSFFTKDLVKNEPVENNMWDIVFTTYKETIPDDNGKMYPYIIRGALINDQKLSVCQIDNGIAFEDCNLDYASKQSYNKKLDEIGYDWKQYSQSAGKYTIVPNRYYLLKTKNGNIFKMRFVDFYDDQGRKGFPKLAWQILN
jgi:predicted transcriptional regulator